MNRMSAMRMDGLQRGYELSSVYGWSAVRMGDQALRMDSLQQEWMVNREDGWSTG